MKFLRSLMNVPHGALGLGQGFGSCKVVHEIFKASQRTDVDCNRYYHASMCYMAGKIWREKKGLPANPNAYGPLTDRPDYHFIKDGRKAPAGSGKIRRVKEQRMWMEKIMQLNSQMDFAVDRYERKVKEKEEWSERILSKLKEKGKIPSQY